MQRHTSVAIPKSKLKLAIADILKQEGFIRDFSVQAAEKTFENIVLDLKYTAERQPVITGLKRVSRPGLRSIPNTRIFHGYGVAWGFRSVDSTWCDERLRGLPPEYWRRSPLLRLVDRVGRSTHWSNLMSRIGRKPISLPQAVTVTVGDGNLVTVTGPKATLTRHLPADMRIIQDQGVLTVERPSEQKEHKALHGLTRPHCWRIWSPASATGSARCSRSTAWATARKRVGQI